MDDSYAPMRGRYRSPQYRRLSHGLMMRKAELSARDERMRDLAAWQLVLPADAVFTHVTAAWLSGWWLPQLPEYVPTFASTAAATRPRRAGLSCSRLGIVATDIQRCGFPVDHPAQVLLRAARDLAVIDLVVLIDSALARGDVDVDELRALSISGRAGSRRLRAALALSHRRTESAWESVLRVFHEVAEVDVEPQVNICDQAGVLVARADLLVLETGDLHEYDGGAHDDPRQRTSDLRRLRRLQEAGRVRRGFTAADLVVRASVTMHELDRALGRSHDPRRTQRWLTLLKESCLTAAGRDRLQNRWLSTRHWSQTPA